jgi:NAD+ synthase
MENKYKFDATQERINCVNWIKEWFSQFPEDKTAVIGMSGGKDSTIAAALIAEAIGKHRVIGVAMPDKNQGINDADRICEYLGIRYLEMSIDSITKGFTGKLNWSEQTLQNIPPRIRMTMLYAVAQTYNGFPVNTCNLSEDHIGYSTIFGDLAGAFSPIKEFTVTELLEIGDVMGIPSQWVHKTPDDGLPHSCPDEQKFGFSYAVLDEYIRTRKEPIGFNGESVKEKIDHMYNMNKFKAETVRIPAYTPNIC